MQVKVIKVVELTVEEAKESLIDQWTDTVVLDRDNTRELIANNELDKFVPDFKTVSPEWIAEQYGELNLGETTAMRVGASHVIVKTHEYTWEVVFDIENLEPKNRWQIDIEAKS